MSGHRPFSELREALERRIAADADTEAERAERIQRAYFDALRTLNVPVIPDPPALPRVRLFRWLPG